MPSIATPTILTDPGYLFRAILGTAEPTYAVTASKFTDVWAAAWVPVGATLDGTDFNYDIKVEPIRAAELLDPLAWKTTDRTGMVGFNMLDWTLTKFSWALNGGTQSIVSGTTTTQINALVPPVLGAETRCMLGWESLDGTVRFIWYQGISSGTVKSAFKRAPAVTAITTMFNLEIPSGGQPFRALTAGTARV